MIINLMRVEGVSPEFMLEKCFFQFQNTTSVPLIEKRMSTLVKGKQLLIIRTEGG